MSVRRVIHRFLIAFGIVVAGSFVYGAYLTRVRRTSPETTLALPSTGTVESLLKSGAQNLDSKHVEQGLIAYRKALTLAPASIEAQLGVARGEFLAGRESVAAQEYERALSLEHGNATALLQLARIYSHQRSSWGQAELRYRDFLLVDAGNTRQSWSWRACSLGRKNRNLPLRSF
jgi:tetratricopeptide (TPR) repeat protein